MAKSVDRKIDFQKSMEEKKILKGLVTACEEYSVTENTKTRRILVDCLGQVIIIEEEDLIPSPRKTSLKDYIGERINFTIKAIAGDIIYGSAKEAQELLEKPIIEKLMNGEVLKGMVTYLTDFGAYITIDGVVSGLMKNYDFADDGTRISEIHKRFTEIKVKYKKTTKNGTIVFLPEERRKGKALFKINEVEKGQSYLGKVTNITPDHQWVTVTINPGVVVGCYFPATMPYLTYGDEVVVKVGKKEYNSVKDKYYLHGKIHRIVKSSNTNY